MNAPIPRDTDIQTIATLRELIAEALDLIPRMSEDDPIAPALAEWCAKARRA